MLRHAFCIEFSLVPYDNKEDSQMAKHTNGKRTEREPSKKEKLESHHRLHPDAMRSIVAVGLFGFSIILSLAFFDKAGPAGVWIYEIFNTLLGWGYFMFPVSLTFVSGVLIISERKPVVGITLLGAGLLLLSTLGIIEVLAPMHGGWLGLVFGSLRFLFDRTAAAIINVVLFIIALIVTVNVPIRIRWPERKERFVIEENEEITPVVTGQSKEEKKVDSAPIASENTQKDEIDDIVIAKPAARGVVSKKAPIFQDKNYVPPPLSLLKSSTEKPTTGDLRANANIIKRTLESFGIAVEMNEINIGPTVTRYTLKPAEGVKLSRITALSPDLALALAAHPIRIEAPIPGKSLVGIEVPNKAAALVRLGSIMSYPEFNAAGPLGFVLGRDVNGEPIFTDIEKMPHLLIAGTTGSGKSVMIHSLVISLLYKNSPATMKMIMIDPKRVELSVYDHLPHLVSPVITDNKKSVNVFRWAIKEMERRYDVLLEAGRRDIKGYNALHPEEPLPYLVIIVDELADLMQTYGREVEGSIIRLAQMARATGIHLILSTQRPSVEVITGLIKANIKSRIALQVASQIDSRTILDTAGADKLLGHGDLLFISSDFSQPKRVQGAYISEEEVNSVAAFIKEHNELPHTEEADAFTSGGNGSNDSAPDFNAGLEDEDDELYDEAVETVRLAQKASTSLLQRKLKLGYARAARLIDLMEARGVVGPGEGAKPRDVYLDKSDELLRQ